jgi:hypothetical protein
VGRSGERFSKTRIWIARAVGIGADLLQIVIFPMVWSGAASPIDDVFDAAVAVAMVALVGWHWAFLPSFLAKLIPGVEFVPTWTAAVLIATRNWKSGGPGSAVIDTEVVRPEKR